MTQTVALVRTERNESILAAIMSIGRSAARCHIFETVYRGKKQVKAVADIAKANKLSEKRVLTAGKKLVDDDIIHQVKIKTPQGLRTAYKKIATHTAHKQKVLAGIKNLGKAAAKYPTKQRPQIKGVIIERVKVGKNHIPKLLTVDEIDSFHAVRGVDEAPTNDFSRLAERVIKEGFQKILKQEGTFKDWGGETNDLFTGKLKYKGSRIHAAFAFKGKATKGALVPKKMGKHGDQINRLFGGPAQIFLVVYPREVKESIYEQMRVCALGRAMSGDKIYYCVIGGSDFARLYHAYPAAFGSGNQAK